MEVGLTLKDNEDTTLVFASMPEETSKTVPLRLLVSDEFKSRLKAQAGRMGWTMGEVVESIANEPLKQLELESIQPLPEQPSTLKELVRQRYFELMNSGKLGHQRLKELSFGQSPSAKERNIISEVLGLEELPE